MGQVKSSVRSPRQCAFARPRPRWGSVLTQPPRACEEDIPGLVAHKESPNHLGRRGGDVDDTDAIGEVIGDPYDSIGRLGESTGFHADGDRGDYGEALCVHGKDLELVVRDVCCEKT